MDPYRVLEIRSDASPDAVTAAYVRLIKEGHPGSPRDVLERAYEILSDPIARTAYDNENGVTPVYVPPADVAAPQPGASRPGRFLRRIPKPVWFAAAGLIVAAAIAGTLIGRQLDLATRSPSPAPSFSAASSAGPATGRTASASAAKVTTPPAATASVVPTEAPSGPLLAAVKYAGKWGYIHDDGTWAIPAIYDMAYPFKDGVAAVLTSVGHTWQLIDTDNKIISQLPVGGQVATPADTDTREDAVISDGRIMVSITSGGHTFYGFIDTSGALVVGLSYEQARPFSEGLAAVNFGDADTPRWGYIDRDGAVAIEGGFLKAEDFHEGMAYVVKSTDTDGFGFIDRTGTLLIHPVMTAPDGGTPYPVGISGYAGYFVNGVAPVKVTIPYVNEKRTVQGFGLIDRTGEILFQTTGLFVTPIECFSEGLYPVSSSETDVNAFLMGFVDATGNLVIQRTTSWTLDPLARFSNGLCPAQMHGSYGFLDHSGRFTIPPAYLGARNFSNGLAAVRNGAGRWLYIDTDGHPVGELLFTEARDFTR